MVNNEISYDKLVENKRWKFLLDLDIVLIDTYQWGLWWGGCGIDPVCRTWVSLFTITIPLSLKCSSQNCLSVEFKCSLINKVTDCWVVNNVLPLIP